MFSSGYGAKQELYSDLFNKMVDKGFVVIALEHPCSDATVTVNGSTNYSQGIDEKIPNH